MKTDLLEALEKSAYLIGSRKITFHCDDLIKVNQLMGDPGYYGSAHVAPETGLNYSIGDVSISFVKLKKD